MIDYFAKDGGGYYFKVDSEEMFSFFRIIDHLTTDGACITNELVDEAKKLRDKIQPSLIREAWERGLMADMADYQIEQMQISWDGFGPDPDTCSCCSGEGVYLDEDGYEMLCKHCDGSGVLRENEDG